MQIEELTRTKKLDALLAALAMSLENNVRVLRTLSDRIGAAADEHDRGQVNKLLRAAAGVFDGDFPIPQEVLEATFAELDAEVEDPREALRGISELSVLRQTDEAFQRWEAENPRGAKAFNDLVNTVILRPVAQGNSLRQGVVVALVSSYEALLAGLVHVFYSVWPEAMPAGSRTMDFSTLRQLASIEEAQQELIAEEAEQVVRETTGKQLKYVKEKLGVNTRILGSLQADLSEVV